MPIIGVTGSQNTKSFLNPNAPTIGTATDVGTGRAYNNGAATVTFTAAASGAPATSFTAVSTPGSYTATGASSPLTVTGLQSNTSYTFHVYASNAVGPSANSASSNSITATTVPQAPTIGTITSNTSSTGRMNVPYTAGADGGKTVTTFTATSSPGSVTATGSSPILVTGLTPGTTYTFTVTATNANGTSSASSASNSAVASRYVCTSGGNVSGTNCSYGASSYSTYVCPSRNQDCQFYQNTIVQGCEEQNYGIRCCYLLSNNQNSMCCPVCSLGTAYYCPNGGNLSGTTCTYAATIQ